MKEVARDGNYIAYDNDVVHDTKTGIEWLAGPDKETSWNEAKAWVKRFAVNNSGWRIPTREELMGLYEKGKGTRNMTPLLKTTGWQIWSKKLGPFPVGGVNFRSGNSYWYNSKDYSDGLRATSSDRVFAVRSRSR